VVMVVGLGVSGYQLVAGKPVGWVWIRNPTYLRVTGAIGVVVAASLLIYWFVAIGPSPS